MVENILKFVHYHHAYFILFVVKRICQAKFVSLNNHICTFERFLAASGISLLGTVVRAGLHISKTGNFYLLKIQTSVLAQIF